jgi:hypothetical protein
MKLCKEAIKFILSRLGDKRLGITTIDSNVKRILPLSSVTDKKATIQLIESIFPGSYTNLSKGLSDSLREMETSDETRVKYILVFTDGCANEGVITKDGLLNLMQRGMSKSKGINVVIMGYGNDCNSTLLQSLAEDLNGSYHQLNCAEDIPIAMGEEFGTALQTCQQNIILKYDSAIMTPMFDTNASGDKEGTSYVGDLLLSEERLFLFKLTDPSLIHKASVEVEYLSCNDGTTHVIRADGHNSQEDAILVSDTENIITVSNATRKAALFTGDERREIIRVCIEKLNSSQSRKSDKTLKLICDLQEQLEASDNLLPESFRSYSSSARNQRGGDFASEPVALMRGLSQGAVFEACTSDGVNPTEGSTNNAVLPHNNHLLYPGAKSNIFRGLSRQTKGNINPSQID